jgi:hypothetical protein
MKILRSLSRRDSTVVPTGYFTTLTSKRWFAASRLPGVPYLVGQIKGTAALQADENPTENPAAAPTPGSTSVPVQKAPGHADGLGTAILSQSMIPSTQDHRVMRPALIVLAATAITATVLWWLCFHHV